MIIRKLKGYWVWFLGAVAFGLVAVSMWFRRNRTATVVEESIRARVEVERNKGRRDILDEQAITLDMTFEELQAQDAALASEDAEPMPESIEDLRDEWERELRK